MSKKPILALAAALAVPVVFGLVAHAQNAAPASSVQVRLAQLAGRLHLTPQQEAQAQGLVAQARLQARTIRADRSLTADERRSQMLALGLSTRRQITALLTPTQRKQAGLMVRRRLERLAGQLGLTPEQRTQIRTILAGGHRQVKTVRQDALLDQAQKRTQVRAIFEASKQQALAVLTPTQLRIFDTLKGEWLQRAQ